MTNPTTTPEVARPPFSHDLKTWPDSFIAVRAGTKTHEVRFNDRDFRIGDTLRLLEWIPDAPDACNWQQSGDPKRTGRYTGESLMCEVTFITEGVYGLPSGLCVMSIKVQS